MPDETALFVEGIVSDIFTKGEFTNLRFDAQTLNEFKKALVSYRERDYDACIQTVWKQFELALKELFKIPVRDMTNIAELIDRTEKEEIWGSPEAWLTRGFYKLRGISQHDRLAENEILIAKAALLLSIPLLWNLKRSRHVKSAKLDELLHLPDEETIKSYLKHQSVNTVCILMEEIFDYLSLVHDNEQLSTSRNLLTAIKLAPLSRDNDAEKLRIFNRIHEYTTSSEMSLIVIQHFYETILNSLDDLSIKQFVLHSAFLDDYVSDLGNATSFEDAKTRAKIIALFANKLTKRQKLRIASAIIKQNQVLGSFGAQDALGHVMETIREDIPRKHLKTLKDNNFLRR